MERLFLIILTASTINGQPCVNKLSVDLTGGQSFSDKSILKDGTTFPSEYVFNRNVSGEIRQFGCLCELRKCLRKCCPLDMVQFNTSCTDIPETDIAVIYGLDLYFRNSFKRKLDVKKLGQHSFLYGKPCPDMYIENARKWYIQEVSIMQIYLNDIWYYCLLPRVSCCK